ncbi:MAG: hypothetical protein FJZ57_02315, partial [Chlamydiae bacterium]|nr:hypothetical protein [Chlamydiota bacterium]
MSLIPFDANDPHLHDEDYTYKMLLDESQKANLNTLLSKKVKICNKDNSLNLSIEAFRLIEAVSESCIHMFSFIKGERLKPFCVKERFKRLDSLHHATTIRGSTNCDLLMNKMPERDLDVVLKFGISPSIFGQIADGRSKKMESFCYYLCMNALQILFPEECKMSLLYDRQRETFFTDERTLNRISRVSGVFKKFFFAEGLNKCIVTFYPGPNKLDDGFLDVDITLQFSADETCVDGRVFSPIVAREKNAKQETVIDSKNLIDSPIQAMSPTNLSNVDSTNVGWLLGKDSASFAHDAIELVLPEEKGRIYLATAPYFKALFGWTIPDVKKHIVNKNLVIIDSSMFMGYRRFFYELTKGRVPYKDPSGDMETEKALRMLTSYSFQSIPMRSGGELDAYYSFVQDKARGPDFSYNMFYNAFITISILKNSPLVTQSSEEGRLFAAKLDFFSEILQRAFFEQKWQDLFPSFVCNITKICQEKSLQILQDIYTVKSYTRFEVKPAFKESLGTTLRINAYNGKDSGYTLTKVCTINEIFDKLQDIRDALREDFYEQLLQSISSNLKIKTITNTEKVYLLYFLNCISSENLSYKEIGSVKGNYFIFVSLIYKSFQVIPNKELLFCIHGFFHRFHFYLIQQEEFHLLDKMIGTSSIDAFSYLMLSSIFMQNLQDEPSCSSSIEKFYDDLESITSVLKRDFTNNIDPLLEMLDTFSSEFSIPLYLKILCPLSVFSSMKGTEITAKFFAKILSLDDFSWMNDREHFFIEVIFLNIILNQNVRLISEVMPKFRNHFESIFCRQLQQNSSLLSQLDACFYKKIINHAGAGKAVQFYKECLPYLNFDAVKELFEGLLQLDHPIVVLFLQQSDTETQAKLFLSLESSWTKYLSGQIERGQEDYLQALSGMFCVYPYSKDTPAVVFDIAAYLLKYIKDCSKQQQLQFLQQGLIFLSRWKRNAQPHLRNEYVNFILSVKKSRLMQDLSPAIQSKIVTDIYELKKSDLSFSEIMALTVINEATEKSWNEFRLTLFSEAHIDEKAFHQVFTHFRCVPLAANEMIAFSEAQGIGQELVVEYYKKQMAFERSFEKQLLLLQKLSSHDTYIHLVLDQIYRLQINLATQSTMKLLFALVKELSTLDEVYLNAFLQKMVCAEFLGSSIDN